MRLLPARSFFALVLSCAVSACATGPTLKEAALPAVAAGKARIYVYRLKDGDGWAMTPDIKIDDELLGKSLRGDILYKDVPAGRHCVSIDYWPAAPIRYYGTPSCPELAPGEEAFFRVVWKTYFDGIVLYHATWRHEARLLLMLPDVAKGEMSDLIVTTARPAEPARGNPGTATAAPAPAAPAPVASATPAPASRQTLDGSYRATVTQAMFPEFRTFELQIAVHGSTVTGHGAAQEIADRVNSFSFYSCRIAGHVEQDGDAEIDLDCASVAGLRLAKLSGRFAPDPEAGNAMAARMLFRTPEGRTGVLWIR